MVQPAAKGLKYARVRGNQRYLVAVCLEGTSRGIYQSAWQQGTTSSTTLLPYTGQPVSFRSNKCTENLAVGGFEPMLMRQVTLPLLSPARVEVLEYLL